MMEHEKIPHEEGAEPEVPKQLDFDFEDAELKARVKELRKEGLVESYAIGIAKIEMDAKRRKARSGRTEKSA